MGILNVITLTSDYIKRLSLYFQLSFHKEVKYLEV